MKRLKQIMLGMMIALIISTCVAKAASAITAPTIPEGDLQATEMKLAKGSKYAVYSGPGKDYLRGAAGKAVVSTNDWIQVFGKEDGWILIQYAISDSHMRFGWIFDKELSQSGNVKDLQFSPQAVTLLGAAEVTDDPLFSQAVLTTLPEGAKVYHLADMGSWAYIESNSGDPVRGFVNRNLISSGEVYHLEDFPSNNGEQSLSGTVTISEDRIEVKIAPAIYQNGQEIPVSGFLVYDNLSGNLILTLDTVDADGEYVGNAALSEATTSLLIEPICSDDPAIEQQALVILEW